MYMFGKNKKQSDGFLFKDNNVYGIVLYFRNTCVNYEEIERVRVQFGEQFFRVRKKVNSICIFVNSENCHWLSLEMFK